MDDFIREGFEGVISNDHRTLDWLQNKTVSIQALNNLYRSANESWLRTKGKQLVSAHLCWEVESAGKLLQIAVGGLVQLSDDKSRIENSSYFICASDAFESDGKFPVFCKFHFDYACPELNRNSRQPIFHLQHPGKLAPKQNGDHEIDHLHPWLETPRVLIYPMSLALTMHLAFTEFESEPTNRIKNESVWRGAVLRDQKRLIKPFLKRTANKLDSELFFDMWHTS